MSSLLARFQLALCATGRNSELYGLIAPVLSIEARLYGMLQFATWRDGMRRVVTGYVNLLAADKPCVERESYCRKSELDLVKQSKSGAAQSFASTISA